MPASDRFEELSWREFCEFTCSRASEHELTLPLRFSTLRQDLLFICLLVVAVCRRFIIPDSQMTDCNSSLRVFGEMFVSPSPSSLLSTLTGTSMQPLQ